MIWLLEKELKLELRRKSVISGIGLYLLSLVFICYLTFSLRTGSISPALWSALFWLTFLFSVINTVGKSFIGESRGNNLYYFTIASAQAIITAKMVYNALLCFVLSVLTYALFYLFMANLVEDHLVFLSTLILASIGFSGSLTLISSIASKSNNSSILMAVLSFPVVISLLLVSIKITKNAIDGLDPSASYDELATLVAINCIVASLAYLLFPYIWRS